MPQDYLLNQVDRFGRALAQLLGKLAGAKGAQLLEEVATARQTLQEHGVDIDQWKELPAAELIDVLKKDERLTEENLQKLGDLLYIFTNTSSDHTEQRQLQSLTLIIYQYLTSTSSTWSLERQQKIDQLTKLN